MAQFTNADVVNQGFKPLRKVSTSHACAAMPRLDRISQAFSEPYVRKTRTSSLDMFMDSPFKPLSKKLSFTKEEGASNKRMQLLCP